MTAASHALALPSVAMPTNTTNDTAERSHTRTDHPPRQNTQADGPDRLKRAAIAGLVAAAHVAGLLALTLIAPRRDVEPMMTPIQVALIQAEAPKPPAAPPPTVKPEPAPPPPARVEPKPRPQPATKAAPARPTPVPTTAAPSAITNEATAPTPAPAAPVQAAAPAPAAEPAPAPVVAARFDAAYLNNPAPAYPPLSRRMREEGKVMLKVLVSPEGLPARIELSRSSGSDRLDRAAEDAVGRWKFVPARRGDQAIESWVLVPIIFKLQES